MGCKAATHVQPHLTHHLSLAYSPAMMQVNEASDRVGLVEIKFRCPFKLSDARSGKYYYQGGKCTPFSSVPVEYYLQCQLQMLATGLRRCDLVSYSPEGGTLVYTLLRNDELCKLALELLQQVHAECLARNAPPKYLQGVRKVPLNHQQYNAFLRKLARSVKEASCSSSPWTSKFDTSNNTPFLDGCPDAEGSHILQGLRGKQTLHDCNSICWR